MKVEEWSKGRETNVRGLLASLHEVLWEGHNWKPISVGDLLQVNSGIFFGVFFHRIRLGVEIPTVKMGS